MNEWGEEFLAQGTYCMRQGVGVMGRPPTPPLPVPLQPLSDLLLGSTT